MIKKAELLDVQAPPTAIANRVKAMVIERRPGHPGFGRVVRETGWTSNLILNRGMDRIATTNMINLFTFCAAGVGNTPTQDDSGAITATTTGATCNASGAIFASGDVGKLLRFTGGQMAVITGFLSATSVTLAAALNVTASDWFVMFRVTQTSLAGERQRTGNYLTGHGACGHSLSVDRLTNKRTYDFPIAQAVTFDAATDRVTLTAHNFPANTIVQFQGAHPPGGIAFGASYFVLADAANTFRVSATPGGAAVDITSGGTSVVLVTDTNYTEVGFSDVSAPGGASINARALFDGGAITVLMGQQLRIVYEFHVTLAPVAPRSKKFAITGWPAHRHPVTVDSATDRITLAAHGFAAGTEVVFHGAEPPGGIAFGASYFVLADAANTFRVSATPGGAAVNITSGGLSVFLATNTSGTEQLPQVGLMCVSESGGATHFGADVNGVTPNTGNEPSSGGHIIFAGDASPHPAFPVGSVAHYSGLIIAKTLVNDAYVTGSYTRTKHVTLDANEGNSTNIRMIAVGTPGSVTAMGGARFLFNHPQLKDNTHTLTVRFRWTWRRFFE